MRDTPGTVVGHLSDTHIVRRGDRIFGIDTVSRLEDAIADLIDLSPRADVVIVTGDITAHGEPDEYAVARELFDSIGVPTVVVPGNHDRRAPFVRAFGSATTDTGFVQSAVDVNDIRVVAVDSLDEDRDGGVLSSDRLVALSLVLDEEPGRPTVICLHHPPFATGIGWMDEQDLIGADQLADVVAAHPQVGLIACGHIHRSISANVGPARVAVAPSTAFSVHLDLAIEDATRGVVMGPPAYAVHRYDRGMWVSHVTQVDGVPVTRV